MERLPVEILEFILSNTVLSIKDVINFSSTCHYYRETIKCNNSLWRQKFRDKWPELSNIFGNNLVEYYKEIIYIYKIFKCIGEKLEFMPSMYCKKYEISECELEEWTVLVNEKRENYWYLVTYLMNIVNTIETINSVDVVPLNTPGNKTQQYYASKVLRHIRQVYLSQEWAIFKSLPKNEQLLEISATFVAQWCQPHLEISHKIISAKLDKISNAVKRKLKILYPNHRIFNIPQEVLDKWKRYNLSMNQWTTVDCRQIMQVLKEVLFDDMRFTGNNVAYYMPQNSFINEVLDFKQGLPITLAIIYEAVARRLGLFCQPINFPSHFMLRFTEDGQDWYYIDVFNGGNIVKRGGCPHARLRGNDRFLSEHPVATAIEVVERMANNLEVSARQHTQVNGRVTRLRSSLELLKLVSPQDISALVSLARLYMLHSMDTRSLETFLLGQEFQVPEQAQRVVHMLRDYESHPSRSRHESAGPVEPVERTPDLKFAVGIVMTHLALDYKCVIYDWDKECKASVDWQEQMHVDLLRYGNKQPFYNVLVEDGSHRYVAQENLQPTYDTGFLYLNDDVGRYFSHFYQTHYVPNANKEREYPYDKDVPEQAQRVVHMLRDYESHPSRSRHESAGPVEPVERTPDLKFAVGIVMTHLALDYKCVIYDWDKECKASVDWQEQMHVDLLRYGNKQPFYNVLVEDGSHRYVAQENLQPTYDTGFLYLNDDVGRYFSHFYQTHYVPNANKEREYPYDKDVRLRFHAEFLKYDFAESF